MLRANAPSQGVAKCGMAIWGERNSAIGLSFGFVIFWNFFPLVDKTKRLVLDR
jgi:hypothetical protein